MSSHSAATSPIEAQKMVVKAFVAPGSPHYWAVLFLHANGCPIYIVPDSDNPALLRYAVDPSLNHYPGNGHLFFVFREQMRQIRQQIKLGEVVWYRDVGEYRALHDATDSLPSPSPAFPDEAWSRQHRSIFKLVHVVTYARTFALGRILRAQGIQPYFRFQAKARAHNQSETVGYYLRETDIAMIGGLAASQGYIRDLLTS
jgi:hypothetical protein